MDEEELRSLHEAGHAVAAYAFGIPFDITKKGVFTRDLSGLSSSDLQDEAVVMLAATEVEDLFVGKVGRERLQGHLGDAARLVSRDRQPDRQRYQQAIDEARRLVREPGFVDAVKNLARELRRKGYLNQADAEALIRPLYVRMDRT